jgi:DUF4097 and DUF4098 domain-containing protein YvlB
MARIRHTANALLLAAGLAIVPALTSGCVLASDGWTSMSLVEQTVKASAPHVSGETIRTIANNGSITVTRGDGKDIAVTAHLKMESDERIKATTISVTRGDGNTLEIKAVPPDNHWKSNEGCSFEIAAPEAVAVDLKTTNGRCEATGMRGASKISTSNGAVIVKDHTGSLDLRSSNGKIEATGISGPVTAETSNGAISVHLKSDGVGPVNLETSNGAITLDLPATCAGSFKASTSNGRVELPSSLPNGVTGKFSSEARKTSGKFEVGEGGPASKLETSNGSISVTLHDSN